MSAPLFCRRIRLHREGGAVAVEFAIIAPLLLVLVVGTMTMARAWNVHNVLDHAAREAARYGATSVPFYDADATTVVSGILRSSAIDPARVDPCIAKSDGAAECPSIELGSFTTVPHVEVSLTIPNYDLDIIAFRTQVTLRANAVARYEG